MTSSSCTEQHVVEREPWKLRSQPCAQLEAKANLSRDAERLSTLEKEKMQLFAENTSLRIQLADAQREISNAAAAAAVRSAAGANAAAAESAVSTPQTDRENVLSEQIQILRMQLMINREDFELERRDRERAVDRINQLEQLLLEAHNREKDRFQPGKISDHHCGHPRFQSSGTPLFPFTEPLVTCTRGPSAPSQHSLNSAHNYEPYLPLPDSFSTLLVARDRTMSTKSLASFSSTVKGRDVKGVNRREMDYDESDCGYEALTLHYDVIGAKVSNSSRHDVTRPAVNDENDTYVSFISRRDVAMSCGNGSDDIELPVQTNRNHVDTNKENVPLQQSNGCFLSPKNQKCFTGSEKQKHFIHLEEQNIDKEGGERRFVTRGIDQKLTSSGHDYMRSHPQNEYKDWTLEMEASLQCPSCRRQFLLEDHNLLVDHLDECR